MYDDVILEDIEYCEHCYNITETYACDICEIKYCYDCGARSSYHRIYDYNCCASCSNQNHHGKNRILNYKNLISYNRAEKIKILNTTLK